MPYQGFPSLCPASPPAFRPLPHPPCPHQNPFLFTWRRKKVISTWLVKVSERNQLGLGELLLFFPGNSQGPGTPCPPSSKGLGAGRPCQHSNDQECPRLLSISGAFRLTLPGWQFLCTRGVMSTAGRGDAWESTLKGALLTGQTRLMIQKKEG